MRRGGVSLRAGRRGPWSWGREPAGGRNRRRHLLESGTSEQRGHLVLSSPRHGMQPEPLEHTRQGSCPVAAQSSHGSCRSPRPPHSSHFSFLRSLHASHDVQPRPPHNLQELSFHSSQTVFPALQLPHFNRSGRSWGWSQGRTPSPAQYLHVPAAFPSPLHVGQGIDLTLSHRTQFLVSWAVTTGSVAHGSRPQIARSVTTSRNRSLTLDLSPTGYRTSPVHVMPHPGRGSAAPGCSWRSGGRPRSSAP